MCQTALISENIVRLGTRSYEQTLIAASGVNFTWTKLASLNHALDSFYELLYSQYNSITEKDYKTFGPQLRMLLGTIKDLYKAYEKMPSSGRMSKQIERLYMNYSAIYELNSDIRQYRVGKKHDTEFRQLLSQASDMLSKIGK